MKQLIILLLLIIVGIIGYGQYSNYKRYNTSNIEYKTVKKIDFNYHNQETILQYHKAVAALNSFVLLQWTANNIDARAPKDDNEITNSVLILYAEKLANVQYYEKKIELSFIFKEKGLSNKEIYFLEKTGTSLKSHQKSVAINKIKNMLDPTKRMKYGEKNPLIFEVQKRLITKGYDLINDGVFKKRTRNAIKIFEEKNNLFNDGYLDILTLDALFQ